MNAIIVKSKIEQIEKDSWWYKNYMRYLFQMFRIKIRKNLNFRFLLNMSWLRL